MLWGIGAQSTRLPSVRAHCPPPAIRPISSWPSRFCQGCTNNTNTCKRWSVSRKCLDNIKGALERCKMDFCPWFSGIAHHCQTVAGGDFDGSIVLDLEGSCHVDDAKWLRRIVAGGWGPCFLFLHQHFIIFQYIWLLFIFRACMIYFHCV